MAKDHYDPEAWKAWEPAVAKVKQSRRAFLMSQASDPILAMASEEAKPFGFAQITAGKPRRK